MDEGDEGSTMAAIFRRIFLQFNKCYNNCNQRMLFYPITTIFMANNLGERIKTLHNSYI